MGKPFKLRQSNDTPAWPKLRHMESWALADRRTIGYRFGEPCDPRDLVPYYDVRFVLETPEEYAEAGINPGFPERVSGMILPCQDGNHMVFVNPSHAPTRRRFTLAHELGHLVLGHRFGTLKTEGPLMDMPDITQPGIDIQEWEANNYALALLLPYAPLLQLLEQGITMDQTARLYGISIRAVAMRLKVTGLWSMRR